MSFTVRAAALADIRRMAELISAVAHPISSRELADWMDGDSAWSAWHLAETDAGEVVGLQWVGPAERLPREACDIATFVAEGREALAIGSNLFEVTARNAELLGYLWIGASVSTQAAEIYYQSRGFRPYGEREGSTLLRYDID